MTDARNLPQRNKTWVLVADEAIARVMELPSEGGDLFEVDALADPQAHARDADFRHDAYGRRSGSPAQHGSSTTNSAGENAEQQEAARFAREVAQRLEAARRAHRFDTLRVVAAPRFLGHLRRALPTGLAETVSDDLNKDLTHLDAHALTVALFPPVQPSLR